MEEIPLLKDFQWKTTYKSNHGNLVRDFLIPALERSILYRRVAGYYSSSILVAAAGGIAKLLKNDGKMQLIIGADLSLQDVNAINQDPEKIMEIIQREIPQNLDNLNELERFITERRFNALSWMLYKGQLKIKIALVLNENNQISENQNLEPIFHDKWGMFYDQEGNSVGFIGSVNESRKGWLENHEKIKVFKGWDIGFNWLEDDINDFENYWNDNERGIKVLDVSEAIEQKLIKYRQSTPPNSDPFEVPEKLPKISTSGSEDPNKLLGIYNGLNFMTPEEFKFKQMAGFIDAAPGIQHNWNDLFNTISFEPMSHQEIIAYEVYKNYPRGYILCDEVGLGKTIEAGLALKWLILAGKVKRVLIIVPKNIVKQWQEELREKFNLEFYIYDGRNLVSYWDEKYKPRTYNSYNAVNLILVSSGLVQIDKRKSELLNSYDWDLIIIDEAHHLRRRPPKIIGGEGTPTRLLNLAQELKKKTKCFLLMTATPIQMRIQELFDLLKLLGLGGQWGLKDKFDKFYEIIGRKEELRSRKEWKFLVEMAKDFLKWGRIEKNLYEEELFEYGGRFQSDFRNIFIKDYDFMSYIKDHASDKEYLREFSKELEVLSPLRWFMFRNTRNQLRDYGINIPIRIPNDEPISMKGKERSLYVEIENYLRDIYKKSIPEYKSIIGFTLAIYRRRLTSSFTAIQKTLERRLEILKNERDGTTEQSSTTYFEDEDLEDDLIDEYDINASDLDSEFEKPSGEFDEFYEEEKKKQIIFLAKDSLEEEIEYLENFINDIKNFLNRSEDTKFEKFRSLLDDANIKDVKKVLVFTQYTDTLKFLRKKLRINPNYQDMACYSGSGGEILVKNESTNDFEWEKRTKEDIKNWFFEEGGYKIMICTDAASEGLNFQVCNWMINYDLPWNPMKVEQRIGRIDRVKQEAERLYIFNLIYNETIEGRIYKKLWDRIRLFQNIIGPLRPILNVYQKAEKFAIEEGDDALTEHQVERMLGNVKEETERAQERHDFFVNLLKKRITPSLDNEKKSNAIISSNDNFDWINSFFNIKYLVNLFDLIKHEEDKLLISLIDKNSTDLFISSDNKLIKGKTKKEKRKYLNFPYTFSITVDKELFTKYPSNYYFTRNCVIFSNFVSRFAPHKDRFIPAIFISDVNVNYNKIMIITRIILSRYPILNKEFYLFIEIDLESWDISNIVEIGNIETFNSIISNTTSNLNSRDKFLKVLNIGDITTNKIKTVIRKSLKKGKLNSQIPDINSRNILHSINWKESEKSFKALKKSFEVEIKAEIIKWLLMECLSEFQSDSWNNPPEKLHLDNCYEKLLMIEEREKIIQTIEDFNLEFESMQISKDDETFIELFNRYRRKNKRRLLKADQRRLKTKFLSLIEKYREEIKIYNSRRIEFIRQSKITHPQILVCGIIFE